MASSDIEMTTMSTIQRTLKRSNELYDPDDKTVLSSAKKMRAEPEIDKKVKCLKFILYSYEEIHKLPEIQIRDLNCNNINIAIAITNCIFSSFNIKRQEANGFEGNAKRKSEKTKSYTITSKGINTPIPIATIHKCVDTAAERAGLEFKRFGVDDKENWYGTAAPYLCFFSAFSMRLKEIRVGNGVMPFSREDGISKSFPVAKYGLNESHHILLEGCSYPPEKRSAMAQTLGPMTSYLLHVRSEEKYRKKWTDATKKAMAHVPFIDEILEVVKSKKAAEIAGITSTLADILRIASSRQANRMFFPLNFLHKAYNMRVDSADFMIYDLNGVKTNLIGGDELLKAFNVSGSGGYYLYKLCCFLDFELEGTFSQEQARQLIFHAIFGTYKEDLSVLEQITKTGNWFTREDFKNSFQKMTMCGRSVEFKPVELLVYSKLSNANQTGLLTSNYGQTSSMPVFSGIRKQRFTDDFFEQLGKRIGGSTVSKNIPQLNTALTKTLSDLQEELEKRGKSLNMGTVEWRSMAELNTNVLGAPVNFPIEAHGKFFLGRNN